MEEEGRAQEPGGEDYLFAEEPIQAIRQRYNFLTELWLLGEIDDEKYTGELAKMIFADAEGALWFISPLNGNWYRIAGEEPELGEPPPILLRPSRKLLEESAAAAPAASPCVAEEQPVRKRFCTRCGSRLREDARFCRDCGAAVKKEGGAAVKKGGSGA